MCYFWCVSPPGPEQPAGRPATNKGNRFSALQQATSGSSAAQDSDRRVPQRNSSSLERGDCFDRSGRGNDRFDRRDDRDRNRLQVTKRSFSRENEGSREREQRGSADPVRRVASMTDDRGSRERARSKEDVTREKADTPPPPPASTKPTLTEEELTKKSTAIIEEYLHLNDMRSHKKAGAMWQEGGLRWRDFLAEDVDVNKFVTEKANLDEQQISSNMLVRALMTCICQSAIIYENPNKVDAAKINKRAKVLQKYLNLLRMFFDSLYDEDVIKEEAFYKWESSKDPAEQQGKGVALKSVTAFLTWLREAEYEDESDNS
ncbi:hypothetical protein F7725_021171 [Dissostichus mawsoni]|uniref:W2 domain-containing protein n=1 Tax=Dissostichus mawsoni TaxID=36200 RepID=A0A7J5YG67_DISMA|nr:hypothetical protein F7725_021171 [Dissostichus mawsoni]